MWNAFIDLDRSRQHGFGHPQPISISEVEAYIRLHGIEGEEKLELIKHVSDLDKVYMVWQKEQSDKKGKK